MLSFGWSEIALVVVIIIIVVGPKEIPNLLKQLGTFYKSLKKISREFKSSLNDLADQSDIKEVKKSIKDIKDIKNNLNLKNELSNEISSIKETVQAADKEMSSINDKINKD